jgi:microcin C transport system permease protein
MNPITRKRLRRFRERRRAWYSLLALAALYGLSLVAELWCNDVPLMVWHQGRPYFPFLRYYADDVFTGSGLGTRPDYRRLGQTRAFQDGASWMVWPLLRCGPFETIPHEDLTGHLRVECRLEPRLAVSGISVDDQLAVTRALGLEFFAEDGRSPEWSGRRLDAFWQLPGVLTEALARRFANQAADRLVVECPGQPGMKGGEITLAAYQPRSAAPRQVRLTVREQHRPGDTRVWKFAAGRDAPEYSQAAFAALPAELRQLVRQQVEAAFAGPVDAVDVTDGRHDFSLDCRLESVRFPFRPVPGHWFGLDDAGRDVLARILYGLRTSLSFGLILVVCSLSVGTLLGSVQGYLGGVLDLTGQRLIEIWSALPFLYIIILMGSIYGPGFWLMIFCYALFNWIGISYYMRAEMLRLRRLPFVESARCLGLPGWKIVFRHILPNAVVPLITFFPFSLVGAIGSLAALDYLGFGLPPPTPSLGQLLQQAQSLRWAWWLILYPSATLFLVMLLGVFVGEGVREAFDPRQHARLE